MKDLRDPQALGETLLLYRSGAPLASLSQEADRHVWMLSRVPDYDGGGLMSNDPALHHSRTPQTQLVESDGGE